MLIDIALQITPQWRLIGLHGASLMANRFLRWDKSTSDDVVGYRVRIGKGAPPADDDPYLQVGDVDVLDLTTVPALADADGEYHFAVAAVDDVGLESPHARVSAMLDFVPPAAPTNLRVTES